MKRMSALIGAALATLVGAPHAVARTVPCDAGESQCTRVTVPFDRGAVTTSVALHVQRVEASSHGAGTLIVLPGGPGQSASANLHELLEALGPRVRERWTIVVFDPRGTGQSKPVLCPLLQHDPTLRSTDAAAACARTLEATRSHYTTWNNVQDLEAVRASLGVDRVALFGTSYGTRVAMGYAAAYPRHVDRVVLDSVVAPEGPASVTLESFAAMRRILASLCPSRCHGVTRNLVKETARLATVLRRQAMTGTTYDEHGTSRPASIDAVGLLDLLFAADLLQTAIRGGLATAITSARHGDPAALLRLATVAKAMRLQQPPEFSAGAYAATTCAELRPPWNPAAELPARPAQAAERFDAVSDSAFVPFDRRAALMGGLVPLCLQWPTPTPTPTPVPWWPIAAPTLILAGTHDVRAPLEHLDRITTHLPAASVLRVPSAGHSVFGNGAPDGCARRAVVGFLLGSKRPRRCPRLGLPTPAGLAPTALADLRPVRPLRGRPGRTLRAVQLTLSDVAFARKLSPRGGGLRGGSYASGAHRLRLRSIEYVPGVRISASERDHGRRLLLRISGDAASHGTLTLAGNGQITGHFGTLPVPAGLRIRTGGLLRTDGLR